MNDASHTPVETWKGKLYKTSCYAVGAMSVLIAGWFIYLLLDQAILNYNSWLNTAIIATPMLILAGFEWLAIACLDTKRDSADILIKLDSWAYYLLLRASFIVLIFILIVDVLVLKELIRDWRVIVSNSSMLLTYICVYVYSGIVLYNLVASIFIRKQIIRRIRSNDERLIGSIGAK